ncbi:MAG: LysR substrate-binding domain-containing protein [Ignavibacteriales bacterium]
MVSLVQLSYIVAVDNYRHFATAAKNCFVTQPTLSMQIQKLEEDLGILIFDRSRQPVAPTDIGKSVIAQARRILQETSRIQDLIEIQANQISGTLRMGVIPTVAPYLLPLFLDSFLKRYPKVDLIIDEIQTDQIIEKLRKEEIDLGLMATPLYQSDLIEKPLFYEPFVGYVSEGHRLFSKQKISPEDLSLKDLLLLKEGHCFRNHTMQLCRDEKLQKVNSLNSLRFEGGNLDTLKKLVEKNFGMTLLPYLAMKDIEGTDKYRYVREFEAPVPKREISLVYLRAYLKKHIISAIEEEILNSVSGELLQKENSILVV